MRIGFIRGAAALAVAGAAVAGVFVGVGIGSDNGPSAAEVKGVVDAAGPGTRSADFARASGRPNRSVFVERTQEQGRVAPLVCVWDAAPDGTSRMGGCNPEGETLGGHRVFVNFAAEGGPPPDHPVTDARLSGVAVPGVASLRVRMSDGSARDLRLARSRARYRPFAFRVADADLGAGVLPVEVVATSADGTVVDTVPTGFPQQ